MDYTVHGILQARILEWVAFPFSRGSSQPRDRTQVSHIAGEFFTSWATREAQRYFSLIVKKIWWNIRLFHRLSPWLSRKRTHLQCRRCRRQDFDPSVGKIPWKRKRQPTPVFLLGKSLWLRSLVGYSPWDCKESDMTEWLSTSFQRCDFFFLSYIFQNFQWKFSCKLFKMNV